MSHLISENQRTRAATLCPFQRGALALALLLGCSAEHDAGYHAACTAMYQLSNGVRGNALNEVFPGDGGRYCVEALLEMDCVGNYCKRNEGQTWTR